MPNPTYPIASRNSADHSLIQRRSFMALMAALGASWIVSPQVQGQTTIPASQSFSPSDQPELIRNAAVKFLQVLTPDHRSHAVFQFPKGETPAIAKFARAGGMGGGSGPRGRGGPDSRPSDRGPDGGPHNGPPDGGRGGGPGRGGFEGFVGEKYGLSVWSNFPVSDVIRPGLRMGELSATQQQAAHDLLKVVLSPMGYQKVLDIMAADQTLADAGTQYAAGLAAYTIAIFGQPDAKAPWMLQFGGHHLGLNVTFVGDQAVLAPLHTGILPSKFQSGSREVRALGRENDIAFDLLASLTPQQRQTVMIDHEISDLVRGPGHPDTEIVQQGVRGADMTDQQRIMLFDLIKQWVGMLNDFHVAQRLADIRSSLADTYLAWSGSTSHDPDENGAAYFRIHGPSLLIEFAPQGNQGGYKLHVHTVMRDLQNDYARKLVS